MSDRKYKQRGYREDDAGGERPKSSPRPSPDRRDAPRGRGLGAPTEDVFRCARCGEVAEGAALASIEASCAKCGSDLHTCTNCTAFDTGSRWECRREIPARVAPKDRANRCDQFEPRLRSEFAREKAKPGDARAAFDALFKI